MATSKNKKNYIRGSAREVVFEGGVELINVDLNLDDIKKLPATETGYVKIVVARRRTPDQFGNTHSVYENDFKPDPSKRRSGGPSGKPEVAVNPFNTSRSFDEGSPFGS